MKRNAKKTSNPTPLDVFEELAPFRGHPRAAIVVAHAYIEFLINFLVENECKHGKKITENHRDYPHAAKLVILNEKGVLDDDHFHRLNALRLLRNDAAHTSIYKISKNKLRPLIGKNNPDDPEIVYLVCKDALYDLWDAHVGTFRLLLDNPDFAAFI